MVKVELLPLFDFYEKIFMKANRKRAGKVDLTKFLGKLVLKEQSNEPFVFEIKDNVKIEEKSSVPKVIEKYENGLVVLSQQPMKVYVTGTFNGSVSKIVIFRKHNIVIISFDDRHFFLKFDRIFEDNVVLLECLDGILLIFNGFNTVHVGKNVFTIVLYYEPSSGKIVLPTEDKRIEFELADPDSRILIEARESETGLYDTITVFTNILPFVRIVDKGNRTLVEVQKTVQKLIRFHGLHGDIEFEYEMKNEREMVVRINNHKFYVKAEKSNNLFSLTSSINATYDNNSWKLLKVWSVTETPNLGTVSIDDTFFFEKREEIIDRVFVGTIPFFLFNKDGNNQYNVWYSWENGEEVVGLDCSRNNSKCNVLSWFEDSLILGSLEKIKVEKEKPGIEMENSFFF